MRCGVSFEKIYINICLFLGHKLSCWGLDSFSHPQNFCRCLSLHSPSHSPLCNNICIFFVVQLKSGSNNGGERKKLMTFVRGTKNQLVLVSIYQS